MRRSILEDNKIFGDLQVDKVTRRKIYDNISKPVYKDPETGELFTAIQNMRWKTGLNFLRILEYFLR